MLHTLPVVTMIAQAFEINNGDGIQMTEAYWRIDRCPPVAVARYWKPAPQVDIVPAPQVDIVPAPQVDILPAPQVNILPAPQVDTSKWTDRYRPGDIIEVDNRTTYSRKGVVVKITPCTISYRAYEMIGHQYNNNNLLPRVYVTRTQADVTLWNDLPLQHRLMFDA